MSERTAFENARIVTADAVHEGGLIAADGAIQEILPKGRVIDGAVDLDGDYLLPGLVELHTDNLERQFQPRLAVREHPARSVSRSVQMHRTRRFGAESSPKRTGRHDVRCWQSCPWLFGV